MGVGCGWGGVVGVAWVMGQQAVSALCGGGMLRVVLLVVAESDRWDLANFLPYCHVISVFAGRSCAARRE